MRAGTSIWVRMQVQGASPTTVRMRAWADGSPEPVDVGLHRHATRPPGCRSPGAVGIQARLSSSGRAPAVFSFDGYLVTTLCTRTRARAGRLRPAPRTVLRLRARARARPGTRAGPRCAAAARSGSGTSRRRRGATPRRCAPRTRRRCPQYGDVVTVSLGSSRSRLHVGLREVEARGLVGLEQRHRPGRLGERLAGERHAHVPRARERVDAVVRVARVPGQRLVLLEDHLDVRRREHGVARRSPSSGSQAELGQRRGARQSPSGNA